MFKKEELIKIIDVDTFETDKRKKPVRLTKYEAPEEGRKVFK
jgi:hypothetical protein